MIEKSWAFMLACEPLCLSAQSVISLSVKTLLKHVGSVLFLLNSAGFLSVKSFGCWVSHVGVGVLVFECSIRDFFECQSVNWCSLFFCAIVLVVSATVAGFCGLAVSGIILLFLVSGLGYPPLIRFRFSSSAHAMVFKGTFNVFLFPQGTQVTNLCLLNSSF